MEAMGKAISQIKLNLVVVTLVILTVYIKHSTKCLMYVILFNLDSSILRKFVLPPI